MLATFLATPSTNQMLPSGPTQSAPGPLVAGNGNSLTTPAGVIRAIAPGSVNQILPSGPEVMLTARDGVGNSTRVPVGVIRAITGDAEPTSRNQMFPSGPEMIRAGSR